MPVKKLLLKPLDAADLCSEWSKDFGEKPIIFSFYETVFRIACRTPRAEFIALFVCEARSREAVA
jgi:hypothetical protein